MAHAENLSIGVFIDGGYYAKIDEGLAKQIQRKLAHPSDNGNECQFIFLQTYSGRCASLALRY